MDYGAIKMKKSLLTLTFILFSMQSFAVDSIALPNKSFDINTENAIRKLEDTIKDPHGILIRFVPAGVSVKNKSINNDQIDIVASKTVMMMTKTVHIKGALDVIPAQTKSANEICYNIKMDFAGSDQMVTDNIDQLSMLFCATKINEGKLKVNVVSKIIKGANYSSLLGSVTSGIVQDQLQPIVIAVQKSIESQH
jgi:hypothetical protein